MAPDQESPPQLHRETRPVLHKGSPGDLTLTVAQKVAPLLPD